MQVVPDAILTSDPSGRTASQCSVIDVTIAGRHEDSVAAWVKDVVIVESRQALVADAARLERGVNRQCPQSAVTVQIERVSVRSPVRRLEEHPVELGDDRSRTGLRIEHVQPTLLTFSKHSIRACQVVLR